MITAPLSRNRSDQFREDVPRLTASVVVGDNARLVRVVMLVSVPAFISDVTNEASSLVAVTSSKFRASRIYSVSAAPESSPVNARYRPSLSASDPPPASHRMSAIFTWPDPALAVDSSSSRITPPLNVCRAVFVCATSSVMIASLLVVSQLALSSCPVISDMIASMSTFHCASVGVPVNVNALVMTPTLSLLLLRGLFA